MKSHELKIEAIYLSDLIIGTKKSEVRFNDRDYQIGDVLIFRDLLGSCHTFIITHIHCGLGLKEGYVILSVDKT